MSKRATLFHALEDRQAILKVGKTGVYRQVKLYERGGELYAAAAGGYVRLLKEHRTSNPNIRWEEIDGDYALPNSVSGGLRHV